MIQLSVAFNLTFVLSRCHGDSEAVVWILVCLLWENRKLLMELLGSSYKGDTENGR